MKNAILPTIILLLLLFTPTPVHAQRSYSLQIGTADGTGGVVVTDVFSGGAATRLTSPYYPGRFFGMQKGDVIAAVNHVPTPDVDSLNRVLSTLGDTGGAATLTIRNIGNTRFETWDIVAVEVSQNSRDPEPERPETPGAEPGDPESRPEVPEPEVADQPGVDDSALRDSEPEKRDLTERVAAIPRQVHFVICGQSDTGGGAFDRNIKKSLDKIDKLFDRIDDQFVGSRTVLKGNSCNADDIRRTLAKLNPSSDDTVLFYYVGHGAHDNRGHYLQLQSTGGEILARDEIEQAIRNKKVRLGVLITDSCNVFVERPPLVQSIGPGRWVAEKRTRTLPHEGLTRFEDVLLSQSGFVDLNSSAEDQYAWCGSEGALFSAEFCSIFCELAPDSKNWQQHLETIANRTNGMFQQRKQSFTASMEMQKQPGFTPQVFSLNESPAPYEISVGHREFRETIITKRWESFDEMDESTTQPLPGDQDN